MWHEQCTEITCQLLNDNERQYRCDVIVIDQVGMLDDERANRDAPEYLRHVSDSIFDSSITYVSLLTNLLFNQIYPNFIWNIKCNENSIKSGKNNKYFKHWENDKNKNLIIF